MYYSVAYNMCKKYTRIVFLYSIYAGNEQDNSTWYMCYLHAVGTGPCLLYATCMHMAYMHYAHILPFSHNGHILRTWSNFRLLHLFYIICALCAYDMHNIYAADLQLAHMCATCIQDFCKGSLMIYICFYHIRKRFP